jgi:hypothetical protein
MSFRRTNAKIAKTKNMLTNLARKIMLLTTGCWLPMGLSEVDLAGFTKSNTTCAKSGWLVPLLALAMTSLLTFTRGLSSILAEGL